MDGPDIGPLIIDGRDIMLANGERHGTAQYAFQGADTDLAVEAAESAAAAFRSWSRATPQERRSLLQRAAQLLRDRKDEFITTVLEEIHAPELWAQMDIEAWNAPVFLGMRAITAPLAAGNTVVSKSSELSPRSRFLVASLFRDVGFPPGVVKFILFEAIITHKAVKKCNFTGSTEVGRIIASRAASALKPVLLELGGKNFAIVLDDADLDVAAEQITLGAFLNNGQICMCTDIVLCTESTAELLHEKVAARMQNGPQTHTVISTKSKAKLEFLVTDAVAHGATVHSTVSGPVSHDAENTFPATLITGLIKEMKFFSVESFGPLLVIMSLESQDEVQNVVAGLRYGLSAAIFTRNHLAAIELSKDLGVGGVHVNGMTVHDEHTLPHGGRGLSGWGRFGGRCGLDEFLQTRTVVLNP
ncbi:aldehyde dehydrogenase [Aspergillus pseudoustus]|uniref:Aldehyde dehydrogenase n=1 Tax=Aspergillus pseudoustus TaxID=1810923 RepID=A0ABR4J8G6_9EURO